MKFIFKTKMADYYYYNHSEKGVILVVQCHNGEAYLYNFMEAIEAGVLEIKEKNIFN